VEYYEVESFNNSVILRYAAKIAHEKLSFSDREDQEIVDLFFSDVWQAEAACKS
jgi:hypothetical protein